MGRRGNRAMFGALIAGSMIFSSTGAIAAAAPPTAQPDPWAVLSVMSGGASAAALCGAAAVAAVAAAAQPAAGCVLPQVDVAPAAPVSGPPPTPEAIPPVGTEGAGLGVSPLLLVLAAIAAGVGLYLILHHHHHHANSPA